MPYGTIKVDTITFTSGSSDVSVAISGLVQNPTFSGDVTVTGTVSGTIVRGNTVSGATVTGTAGQFGTLTGNTAGFTTVTGTTVTGTTGSFTSGVFASGTAAAPSVSVGTITNGIYSPASNEVAISTGGSQRLSISSTGVATFSANIATNGSGFDINPASGLPNISLRSGNTYRGYIEGNASGGITIGSGPAALTAMTIDSSQRVGIGNSSPGSYNASSDDLVVGDHVGAHGVTICSQNNSSGYIMFADGTTGAQTYAGQITYDHTNNRLTLGTNDGTTGLTIDSSQRVGIGTTAVSETLHLKASAPRIRIEDAEGGYSNIEGDGGSLGIYADNGNTQANSFIRFDIDGTEKSRLTSSGQWLVGTSTAKTNFENSSTTPQFQIESTSLNGASLSILRDNNDAGGPKLFLAHGRTDAGLVSDGDELGGIFFSGGDGSEFVSSVGISAAVDGTPGANDMPGRLVFSTTADGASSPTERMRIDSVGQVLIHKTSTSFSAVGTVLYGGSTVNGAIDLVRSGGYSIAINRLTSDGNLIEFYQDNALEGTISVSGTTVSYNGAHLSRYSQLPSGQERTEILRGTVLSNIDEMCEWGEEENEQLNRMKVSDVEGDKNVSGVFQAWDDDDDTYTNDFYCAMTGDFIIRIGAGVTVERGDLLMSAGDGTAKPQEDDIIRSKTIAKVTSTNVSCTYDDGSYCVPCVLMAC